MVSLVWIRRFINLYLSDFRSGPYASLCFRADVYFMHDNILSYSHTVYKPQHSSGYKPFRRVIHDSRNVIRIVMLHCPVPLDALKQPTLQSFGCEAIANRRECLEKGSGKYLLAEVRLPTYKSLYQ